MLLILFSILIHLNNLLVCLLSVYYACVRTKYAAFLFFFFSYWFPTISFIFHFNSFNFLFSFRFLLLLLTSVYILLRCAVCDDHCIQRRIFFFFMNQYNPNVKRRKTLLMFTVIPCSYFAFRNIHNFFPAFCLQAFYFWILK